MTSQRTEGQTPHGGSYAVAVYVRFGSGGEPIEVDADKAEGMVILAYDASDRMVFETVGYLGDECTPAPPTRRRRRRRGERLTWKPGDVQVDRTTGKETP